MSRKRVVVTGIGAVSCLGLNAPDMWSRLIGGQSGIAHITAFDASNKPITIAGEVKGLDLEACLGSYWAQRGDRFSVLGLAAALEAVEHAGLDPERGDTASAGVVVGNAHSDWNPMADVDFALSATEGRVSREDPPRVWRALEQSIKAERGPEGWMPQFFWTMAYDAPVVLIASRLQATGPTFAISSACVSGAKAVERATRWLRRGHAEIIITGGSESVIDQHGFRVLHAMRALTAHSRNPEHASRPFDKNRAGFVLAEGAGMLVLETLDHARKRNAPILAEVVGVGGSANAFSLYAPEPVGEGPAAAMDAALKDAGVDYHDVDLIVAHATSTGIGDPAEAEGFRMTFKEAVGAIAITAPKSMMGHAIGAAGALGAVHCVQAIQHGVIPPTMNLDDPEEFIAGLDVIRDEAREQPVRIVLNNAFGFGGANGSNIFVRFEG